MIQFAYLLLAVYGVLSEDVRLDNLDPSEASQIIESKDQSLKYAPKIESNVPAVRVLGRDPYNVLEDIYLANQYHGQDGVGGYLYGYSVPDIAKTEKKKPSGDLRGAYNYVNGDGQEIKVEYWDDGSGFHQVDNVPRVLPQQIEDTPEVKAAKEEHARLWQEQAERNSHPPADPNANYGSGSGQTYYRQQGPPTGYVQIPGQSQPAPGPYPAPYSAPQQARAPSAPAAGPFAASSQYFQQGSPVAAQGSSPASYSASPAPEPAASSLSSSSRAYIPPAPGPASAPVSYAPQGPPAGPSSPNSIDYSGQYSEQRQAYAQNPSYGNQREEAEENGPPRGFFYSFDYPVGIIVGNQGRAVQKREEVNAYYDKNKELLQRQLENHGDYRVKREAVPVFVIRRA